jgi:hypothetical protein
VRNASNTRRILLAKGKSYFNMTPVVVLQNYQVSEAATVAPGQESTDDEEEEETVPETVPPTQEL